MKVRSTFASSLVRASQSCLLRPWKKCCESGLEVLYRCPFQGIAFEPVHQRTVELIVRVSFHQIIEKSWSGSRSNYFTGKFFGERIVPVLELRARREGLPSRERATVHSGGDHASALSSVGERNH